MRFTASTKYTTGELDGAIAVTGVGSIEGNDVSSGNGVGVVSIAKISMSSSSDYSVGFSVKVDTSVDLGDTKVCLQYQPQQQIRLLCGLI